MHRKREVEERSYERILLCVGRLRPIGIAIIFTDYHIIFEGVGEDEKSNPIVMRVISMKRKQKTFACHTFDWLDLSSSNLKF